MIKRKLLNTVNLLRKLKSSLLGYIHSFVAYIQTNRQRKVATGLAVIFLLGTIIALIMYSAREVEADWWDETWRFRQRIPLTYSGSGSLTEYQVFIDGFDTASLVTAGKMQSDCDDIRFVDLAGNILDYAIVGATCNTSDTEIWVKTATINNGSNDFYMYYGNSRAIQYQSMPKTFSYASEKTVGYVLSDRMGTMEVISLEGGNSVTHNSTTRTLANVGDTSTFTASNYGTITAKALFQIDDGDTDGTDIVIPVGWAGTEFLARTRTATSGTEEYFVVSPWGSATVRLYHGGTEQTGCGSPWTVTTGTAITCDAADATVTRLTATIPVLVSKEGNTVDAMPWYPATTDYLYGIHSNTLNIAAGPNGADYRWINTGGASETNPADLGANGGTTYGSGASSSYAGDGNRTYSATSNGPIGVAATGDGDGSDGTMFVSRKEFGTRFGSASATDFIGIVSDQAATCQAFDYTGATPSLVASETLASSNSVVFKLPGTTSFGRGSTTTYINGRWYVECDKPAYGYWQHITQGNESNTWQYPMMRQFTYPTPAVGSLGTEETGTGPVSYWKFDEGTDNTCSGGSNDACDSMGRNDGAFGASTAAPSWRAEDMCVSGKCLFFDGSNDYINPGKGPSVKGQAGYTISAWVRPLSNADTSCTTVYWESTTSANSSRAGLMQCEVSGIQRFEFRFRPGTGTLHTLQSITVPTLGRWYHLSAVYDSTNDEYSLYINGVLDNQMTGLSLGAVDNTDPADNIGIGELGSSLTRFFHGFMDEMKVYHYARTADQINSEFTGRGVSKGVAASLGANAQNNMALSDGLAGYWKMNEASGNASDSSGNAITLTNNGTTTYAAGKFGNGSEHVPASSQHFSTATTISGIKSVSFWTNPDSTTNYYISLTSGAYITSSSGTLSATGFTNPKIYVNGTQGTAIAADSWQLVTVTTETAIDANQVYVGRQDTNYYDGTLDEVRLYNRTIDSAEVSFLYNWAPGPVGHWKMDENTGTTNIYDSSGNSYTGTMNGSMTSSAWVPGKIGAALKFDGTDDNISFGDVLGFERTNPFTLMAWVKVPSGDAAARALIAKQVTGGDFNGYNFRKSATGTLTFILRQNGSSEIEVNSTATIDDNNWHHVVVSYDGSSLATGVHIYIDGSPAATSTVSDDLAGNIANNVNLRLGARDTVSLPLYYNGVMDEARIYNYVRNQKQIIEDMNADHPAGGSPIASPLGHWKFDEQQGQTTYDSGFGGNNGTLGANSSSAADDPTWKVAGSGACKSNGCLSFDGSDDVVNVGSSGLVDPLSDYSLSAWVNVASGTGHTMYSQANTANNQQLFLWQVQTSQVIHTVRNNAGTEFDCTFPRPTSNEWTHLVLVRNGSSFSQYTNGLLTGTCSGTASGTYTFNTSNIGRLIRLTSGGSFSGSLDEVKLYNSALTADEIKIDMNAGSAVALGGVLGSHESEMFGGNPPIAWWKMDENTENTCAGGTADVCDTSGNGNDGTKSSSSATTWVPGKTGSALRFDGTANEVAVSDTPFDFERTDSFTITAWVKTTKSNGSVIVTKRATTGGLAGYTFTYLDSSGFPQAFLVNTWSGTTNRIIVYGDTKINDGNWHHVVMTYDGSSSANGVTFYVDGRKNSNTITENTLSASILNNENLKIGCANTCVTSDAWEGDLDDIKIYNYVRSQAQIAYDYNRGAPIAHYKFDECQGTTAYNYAPTGSGLAAGNNGTITIGGTGTYTSAGTCDSGTSTEAWNAGSTGKRNYALGFDGTDDYVQIDDNDVLTPISNTFSTAMWLKWDGTRYATDAQVFASPICKGTFGSGEYCILMSRVTAASDTDLRFYIQGSLQHTWSNSRVDTNWHHLAQTYDGATLKIYFDGQMVTSTSVSPTITNSTQHLYIGQVNAVNNYPWGGLLDDVRYYNYALHADQIKQVYNNGAVYFGPAEGNP